MMIEKYACCHKQTEQRKYRVEGSKTFIQAWNYKSTDHIQGKKGRFKIFIERLKYTFLMSNEVSLRLMRDVNNFRSEALIIEKPVSQKESMTLFY